MPLVALPPNVAEDASSMVTFVGNPDSGVLWGLTGGGTLTPIDLGEGIKTDSQGRAHAIYNPAGGTPAVPGDTVTVTADYI